MKAIIFSSALFCSLTVSSFGAGLVNGGFEDPITSDGPPFVGYWEGFSGGPGALAANSTAMPHSGAQNLLLSISNTDNTFAGVFQDVLGVTPGSDYSFNGWHALLATTNFGVGVEIRIEWRNSVSNTEVSRTPNLTPLPTAVY